MKSAKIYNSISSGEETAFLCKSPLIEPHSVARWRPLAGVLLCGEANRTWAWHFVSLIGASNWSVCSGVSFLFSSQRTSFSSPVRVYVSFFSISFFREISKFEISSQKPLET